MTHHLCFVFHNLTSGTQYQVPSHESRVPNPEPRNPASGTREPALGAPHNVGGLIIFYILDKLKTTPFCTE